MAHLAACTRFNGVNFEQEIEMLLRLFEMAIKLTEKDICLAMLC